MKHATLDRIVCTLCLLVLVVTLSWTGTRLWWAHQPGPRGGCCSK